LKLLHKHHAWWVQSLVLLADLILSGAIIFAAIWLYIRSPLYQGDIHSFAEVLGAFSIFSVFFYSTFLTSVWTWGYILTTWFMRLFTATPLARWVDENNADKWLVVVGSIVVFLAALAVAVPMQKGADGVSQADRLLCSAFPGPVCNRVAELTADEKVQLRFIMRACAGGVTRQCLDRANAESGVDDAKAARLWDAACRGGDAVACTRQGVIFEFGIGVEPDAVRAKELYAQGYRLSDAACRNGSAPYCTYAGDLLATGMGVELDDARAVSRYTQGCEGGNANGCLKTGRAHELGEGVPVDLIAAAEFYTKACDLGNNSGCGKAAVLAATN
jgi:hypothetical protein